MVTIYLMELVPSDDITTIEHKNIENKSLAKLTHTIVPGMVKYVGDEERFKNQKYITFQRMPCFKKSLKQFNKLKNLDHPVVLHDKHSRKEFYCSVVVIDYENDSVNSPIPIRTEPLMTFSKRFLNGDDSERICISEEDFRRSVDKIYHMFPKAKYEWQKELNHQMVKNYHYLIQKYNELVSKYPERKYFFWIFC